MLCWDWSLELRSPKGFAGDWAKQENSAVQNPPVACIALPQGNRRPLHAPPAALPRGITMTAEQRASGMPSPSPTLVLYDGVCGLCNRLVAFLLRRDRGDQFRFAPLQSEFAQTLLHRYGLNPNDFDTVVVLADFQQPSERALTRSQAALWAIGQLGGLWRMFVIAKLVPLRLREAIYRFIARRRYQVFGKYETCPLPRPQDRHKFVG